MGLPDIDYHNLTVEDGWQHCLTVPRELTYQDGVVYQRPVEELKSLRSHKMEVEWGKEISLPERFEVVTQTSELYVEIGRDLVLEYNHKLSRFEMRFLGYSGAGRTIRRCHLEHLEKVQILVDSSSVEVFINDGEVVFSTRFYPRGEGRYFKIDGKGTKLCVYELKSKEMGEPWEN
jgi:beta-fructofuranosidase